MLKSVGMVVGCVAGMVIIKWLNLPWYLTIILIAVMLVGAIYGLVILNDREKKEPPAEGNSSPDKT